MKETNLQLSPAEMELVCNAGIILTKNSILQKGKTLLETAAAGMMAIQQQLYPAFSLFSVLPKVSKGENYQGLPYLVLDYPRQFTPSGIFAVRSFFWWGHFFSSTLQLSGTYKTEFEERIVAAFQHLAQHHYYIGISEDPWQHHFGADNYREISSLRGSEFGNICQRQLHIKIAAKWPLDQWPFAATNMVESWRDLVRICLD